MTRPAPRFDFLAGDRPVNVSRRGFLAGAAAGTLILGTGLPFGRAQAAEAAGTRVPAFLAIAPDGTVTLQSPFVEGGQGIFTGMAQVVGEELDSDPAAFVVVNAPADDQYKVMTIGMRITGGSMSMRMGHAAMQRVGALARAMLIEAASRQWGVPASELSTEPGQVVHAGSGRSAGYGTLAAAAMDLPVPDPAGVKLKDHKAYRWIGTSVPRVDVYAKSTGRAQYAIDSKVDGMLHAAVQHAPRLGLTVGSVRNEGRVMGMPGVHSVHVLDGAVAVVAERFWVAKTAAEALEVDWADSGTATAPARYMPADFSTAAFAAKLAGTAGDGKEAEAKGDFAAAYGDAAKTVTATYHSQYLHHAQLEPPSTLARFNDDGTLDLWLPNQAPEMFQADIAKRTGLQPGQVRIHSRMLGGFFGRHFLYATANPYPQAIELAKRTGRPVKVIWTREEEFLRDPMRPMAAVRFRGALDKDGLPVAVEAVSVCEGPTEGINGHDPDKLDAMAVEGLTGKPYAIPNIRIAQLYVENPVMLAYWRSVGNSMNDFLYETFLDELADAGEQDPFALRLKLLEGNDRLTSLLRSVAEMSGGWKRGPFTAPDGTKRARGIGMASPFGSHAAAIAEVSIRNGQVVVHDVWEALDPGQVVNPALVEMQIKGAAMLGVSQVLMEAAEYEAGAPVARNYDLYPILPPERAPRVHARAVASGAEMGGVGEPPLPAVPPAVANAVSTLTGQRVRSMPLDRLSFAS